MSGQVSHSLLKVLIIWLILVMSNVGDSYASGLHTRRLKSGHHAKSNGNKVKASKGHKRSGAPKSHQRKSSGSFRQRTSHKIRAPSTSITPTSPPITPSNTSPPISSTKSLSPSNPLNIAFTPSISPILPTNPSHSLISPSSNAFSPSISPSNQHVNPPDDSVNNPSSSSFSPSQSPTLLANPWENSPQSPINPHNQIANSPTIPFAPSLSHPNQNANPPDSSISPSNPSTTLFPPSSTPSMNPPTNSFSPSITPTNPPNLSNPPLFPPTSFFVPSISPNQNASPPNFLINPSNPPTNPPTNPFSPSPSPINPPTNPFSPSITPANPPINPSNPPLNPPAISFAPSLGPSPSNPPTSSLISPPSLPPLNPPKNSFSPSISPSNPPTSSFAPSISPSNPPLNAPTNPSTSPTSPPPIDTFNNTSKSLGLQVGFYKGLCPNKNVDIESIITTKVQELFRNDQTLLAALLRMQFHDCFVHGCDASILIDGPSTEKNAFPNLSVRGYEFIDALKEIAESECPDVVSCADIIAIATKELIKLGGGPDYSVQTGRRDGLISRDEDVNLPNPFTSVPKTISAFAAKKFTPEEMVVLFGCHTVGISHCAFFQDRLYQGTNQFDPNMDPNLRQQLVPICPQDTLFLNNNVTFLDQNPESSNIFDNSYFDQIIKQRGILPIDQALARHPRTRAFVLQFAQDASLFNSKLVDAMIKLQALDVLTDNQGEIRKVCSKFN